VSVSRAVAAYVSRRPWTFGFAALLATLLAAACTSFPVPRSVDVSQARLQELVARRFPVQKRLFDLIDVTVDSPRLTMQPESNRVAVELTLNAAGDGVVQTSMAGSLHVSEGLRFEPSDNTVRLVDVRVERFAIEGLAGNWQRQLDRLGKPLAKALLDDQVLYVLRPKDIAGLEGRGVRPGELRVTESGITITLLPIDR
jgi:hypothetical protein